jgi:hypothetical protein
MVAYKYYIVFYNIFNKFSIYHKKYTNKYVINCCMLFGGMYIFTCYLNYTKKYIWYIVRLFVW